MSQADLAEVWARSLEELSDLQIEPHQRAWLRLTRPLGLVENTALIATPNEFVKEQLETRLRGLITHALSREFGRNIQLAVTVDPATAATGTPSPRESAPPSGAGPAAPGGPGAPEGLRAPEGLHPAGGLAGQGGPVGYPDRGYPPQPGQERIAAPGSPLPPGRLDGSVLAGPAIAESLLIIGRDIRDGRKRIVGHVERLDAVLGGVPGLGHDGGEGLPNVARAIDREHRKVGLALARRVRHHW